MCDKSIDAAMVKGNYEIAKYFSVLIFRCDKVRQRLFSVIVFTP